MKIIKRKTIFTPNLTDKGRYIYYINQYFMGKLTGEKNTKFCESGELYYAVNQEHKIGYTAIIEPKTSVENQIKKLLDKELID
tara:strand:+ start:16773 stop:17021 length:249 start_codon:yes stop_codon:yes gene_type:complete